MTTTVFIGGTGTDIGKTYVTCLLLRQLQDRGLAVRAIKPVISGFDPQAVEQSDSGLLLRAMGLEAGLKNINNISPWRFKDPLPPHLAAENTGQPLNLDHIADFCRQQATEDLDFLLIEGVGGIMTPLTYHHTTLDLIMGLECRCLLVTGSALGTLSHTLSAIACLQQSAVTLDGLIISESPLSYTDFDVVFNDFTKIIPHMAIKKISRHDYSEEIFSLII